MGFYREFFTNIQEGLTKERVQNSPSECSAIIAAFMECLKFCLLHEFEDGSNLDIHQYLIKEQVHKIRRSSELKVDLYVHPTKSMDQDKRD